MKEFALDESLSEEARDTARKGLEVLISSQLLDIEQAAELKKLQSEALLKAKTAEATAMLQAAEIKEMEGEAQSKRTKADTMLQVTEGVCEEMAEWLLQHRLQQCAADMVRIAGAYARPHRLSLRIGLLVVVCLQDCAAKRPAVPDG